MKCKNMYCRLMLMAFFVVVFILSSVGIVFAQSGMESTGKYMYRTKIAHPKPLTLISYGVPAYSSQGIASKANDSDYETSWLSGVPGWIVYDLSKVDEAKRSYIDVVWYNNDTNDYDYTLGSCYVNGIPEKLNSPKTYTIEGNSAPGGSQAPEYGWKGLATVENNTYHSRQHVLDFKGYNWLRLNITGVNGYNANINLDVYDASKGIEDSWIFFGDSITAGCMKLCEDRTFAQMVNAENSKFFPIAQNGGIIGAFSFNCLQNIEKWLSVFPGKYVGIAYGTNDAWSKQIHEDDYYIFMEKIVKIVLDAGKVPVIPKIPWAKLADVQNNVPLYNQKIDKLYEVYPQIIKGPDFWTFFYENQYYISIDGNDYVHPTPDGYNAMRQKWADTMIERVYTDKFRDMSTHWAKEDVELMAENNFVKGREENKFVPDESITRAEFATLVVNALQIKQTINKNFFKDVPDKAWYMESVNKAYKAKIIVGVGYENFNPTDKITREQMAVMIMNAYYNVMKQTSDGIEDEKEVKFNDVISISDWAKLSVKIACAKGICNGFPDGTFGPIQNATRAQAVVAIKKLLENAD